MNTRLRFLFAALAAGVVAGGIIIGVNNGGNGATNHSYPSRDGVAVTNVEAASKGLKSVAPDMPPAPQLPPAPQAPPPPPATKAPPATLNPPVTRAP